MTEKTTSTPPSYYTQIRTELFQFFEKPVDSVLELGCGTGATLVALQEKKLAKTVVGIEYFEPAFQRAKKVLDKAYTVDLENGNEIEKFEKNSHKFDVILMPDILEHLRHPEAILARAYRWLKPNGFIVVSVPNIRHYSVLKMLLRGRWDYEDAGIMDRTHVHFFTKANIIEMIEAAGFEVETVVANGGYLPGWKGVLNALSGNRIRPWFEAQYILKAKPITT